MRFCGLSARIYDSTLSWLFFGAEKNARKQVTCLIPDRKLKILDVGCGTGSQLIDIKKSREKAECYGVDSSKDMLEIARKKAEKAGLKINFLQQSYEDLKFEKETFDIVIAFLALHESPYEVRVKAVEEIKRVLNKNGRLILMDYEKARGLAGAVQKIVFLFLEPYGENFVKTKEKAFSAFRKHSSKKFLGILSLNEYEK